MPTNKYSDSLLMDALRGSLSNAESFGRGFGVAPVGLLGDVNALAREYITPRLPANVQGLLQSMPSAPTTESILSAIPRMTAPRMESSGMEQIGAAANPRGPINLGRAVASLPSDVARAGQEFLAAGQPARVISPSKLNLNKGIYKPELTMEEMLKVKDIPTVDRVKQSIDLVGEDQFKKMVDAQYKKYKPTDQDQEAMLVESVTLNILGKAQRSPYPQEQALKLAQERAALPVEQGGLGLLAENTPEMRAQAMGFNTPVYRGYQFGTGRNKNTFYTDNPQIASQYAEKSGGANYEIRSGGDRYLFDTYEEAKRAQKNDVGGRITKLENAPTLETNLLRLENPLIVDAKEKNWNWLEDPFKPKENLLALEEKLANVTKDKVINGKLYTVEQQKQDILRDNYFQVFTDTNRLVEEARKKGYSNAVIKNVYDTALPIEGNQKNYLSNVYVSMNPENQRSRFAAFDPFRKDVATATAMGVALPDLLAAEYNQQPQSAGLLYPLP